MSTPPLTTENKMRVTLTTAGQHGTKGLGRERRQVEVQKAVCIEKEETKLDLNVDNVKVSM